MNWTTFRSAASLALALSFFLVLSLGQLERWVIGSAAIYGHDIIIGLYLLLNSPALLSTFFHSISRVQRQYRHPIFVSLALLLMILAGWLTQVPDWSAILIAGLYVVRLVVYAVFTYWLVNHQPWFEIHDWAPPRGKLTPYLLAVTGVLWLIFGLAQYLLWPDMRFLSIFGWDDHYYRLIGTLWDPAFMGALLVLTWILVKSLVGQRPGWKSQSLLVALTLGTGLTFSRASYLAFGTGVVVWYGWQWWQTRRWSWQPLIWGIIFIIFISLAPKPTGEGVNLLRTSTVTARVTTTTSSLESLSPMQWLVGRGVFVRLPETQTDRATPDHAHVPDNLVVFLVTSLGVGGCLILSYLGWQLRGVWVQWPRWVWASLMAIMVASLFNNTLFQPFVWLWVTMVVWLGLESKVDA